MLNFADAQGQICALDTKKSLASGKKEMKCLDK
jgi:hypothetical protein